MEDWNKVLVFGVRPEGAACVLRASAYVLVADERGRLGLVRTPQGTFLPGGGIEAGETPAQAVVREALEECGLIIRTGTWATRAIQFAYSESEHTHFEKRSTFIDAAVAGFDATGQETDHQLLWVEVETAAHMLSHHSQRWAVEQWQRHTHC